MVMTTPHQPGRHQPGRWGTLGLWLAWAWVTMTVTHELGHVMAGLAGGAQLRELQLQPWRLPYSIFLGDPHPLVTLWAGFAVGGLVPLVVALAVRRNAVWFVAWFCLLANGAYLLLGYVSGDGELDSAMMIRAGARPIELLGVSTVMLLIGYTRFRQALVDLLSGATPPLTLRGLWISLVVLAVTLAIQSGLATALQATL